MNSDNYEERYWRLREFIDDRYDFYAEKALEAREKLARCKADPKRKKEVAGFQEDAIDLAARKGSFYEVASYARLYTDPEY